jgi:hypothetical protein
VITRSRDPATSSRRESPAAGAADVAPVQRPVEITQWDQVLTMLDARNDKSIIPFGGGSPDVTAEPEAALARNEPVIQHNIATC